jgi:hypothetical protein
MRAATPCLAGACRLVDRGWSSRVCDSIGRQHRLLKGRQYGSTVPSRGSLRLDLTRHRGAVELMYANVGVGGSAESTGIQIWPAALVLLRSIGMVVPTASDGHVGFPETSSRILELGSGTGVVGITMACHGHSVTLTDTPHVKIPHYDVEGVFTGEARSVSRAVFVAIFGAIPCCDPGVRAERRS